MRPRSFPSSWRRGTTRSEQRKTSALYLTTRTGDSKALINRPQRGNFKSPYKHLTSGTGNSKALINRPQRNNLKALKNAAWWRMTVTQVANPTVGRARGGREAARTAAETICSQQHWTLDCLTCTWISTHQQHWCQQVLIDTPASAQQPWTLDSAQEWSECGASAEI